MTPDELLSQLKDIHEPAPIGNWPLAPGWWILIVTTISIIIMAIYLWRKHIEKNAWKKEARKRVAEISKTSADISHHESLYFINKLIKQIAVYKLNDPSIRSLTGSQWRQFLETFLNNSDSPDMFKKQQFDLLAEGEYRQNIDAEASVKADIELLIKALTQWIKEA